MRRFARGLLVSALVAVLVVAAASAVPLVQDAPARAELDTREFEPDAISAEQIPSTGQVLIGSEAQGSSGLLVVDASNGNRFDREKLQPLLRSVSTAGYDVEFHSEGDLGDALADADAFVIVDPAQEYDREELDAIESFVNDGGRLLILAEPTRVRIGISLFGVSISPVESKVTTLGQRFNLAFDTQYVYDVTLNDGNFKRPLVTPAENASVSPFRENMSEVGNVSLYTATSVTSHGGGATVLETHDSARRADSDVSGPHPVAVRDENVLAVGDSTFIGASYYNVADNEAFIAQIVEFLVGGDRRGGGAPTNVTPEDGGNATAQLTAPLGDAR